MTVNRVEVRNYQSLSGANVPLGRFTVVTGPTGAGKSALFRALQLLAVNARGTSYITHGSASCSVTAAGDNWMVRIIRSSARGGKSEYQVARKVTDPQRGGLAWAGVRYTKLGGQVPPQVKGLLGLSELNFDSQLEPPYLLADPPSQIARKLGQLTNVSLVFGAAAEANRVRKQHARALDEARERRGRLAEEMRGFAGLKTRHEAVRSAEEGLERVRAMDESRKRLETLQDRLRAAEEELESVRADAARQAPPPLDRLEELMSRRSRLLEVAGELETAQRQVTRHRDKAETAQTMLASAEAALHDVLAAAGQCPVCGQAVTR